jgi:UDP-N-acetylglucosamine 2-epimerase (non-hydrolysing)
MRLKKVIFILGTRPEAIKMAPLIKQMKEVKDISVKVCLTSQHKELLQQVLHIFSIKEDHDLNLMQPNQTLAEFGARALSALDTYFLAEKPDWVFVHGDTSTAMCAALAAYYHQIKVAHVEAGLRTFNKYSPFPEEINRTLIGSLATLHFAPTQRSKSNLLQENIKEQNIFVTGNTVIDAVKETYKKILAGDLTVANEIKKLVIPRQTILITMHRRENFGAGLHVICEAIKNLAIKYPSFNFIYPVHPNPNVKNPVETILGSQKNIFLTDPLNYVDFIFVMAASHIILTDSGGVQEEAPSFGKPVLVLRENTERPEAVDAGTVKLVGTNKDLIISEFTQLMENQSYYTKMSEAINPYGDGQACGRIIDFFKQNSEA